MESLCLRILNAEVKRMRQDPIWLAFAQTGDPLYYLLYRSVKEQEERRPGKKPAGSQTAAVNP